TGYVGRGIVLSCHVYEFVCCLGRGSCQGGFRVNHELVVEVQPLLEFVGPIPFRPDAINDVVPPGVNGVYLWTIPLDDGSFRVYYVGESTNVRQRLRKHYGMQLDGRYTAHDLNDLKRNVRTLVHRATE